MKYSIITQRLTRVTFPTAKEIQVAVTTTTVGVYVNYSLCLYSRYLYTILSTLCVQFCTFSIVLSYEVVIVEFLVLYIAVFKIQEKQVMATDLELLMAENVYIFNIEYRRRVRFG